MSLPSISTMRLLSAPEFASNSTIICAINEVVSVDISQREDGTHELSVIAPVDAAWLESVKARRVVWLKSESVVTEWLVNNKSDSLGGAEVLVRCDPLHRILADYGVIEYVSAAGALPHANLGGVNGTIENFLETYVIPALTARGVTWIKTGTIDFTDEQFTLAFDNTTVLGLIAKLAKAASGVWQLSRDEINEWYEIDILESFGQSLPEVWVSEGRSALSLVRQFDREDLRTALRPIGQLAGQEEERATIGMASHPVLGVSTDTLTLGRHGFEGDATVGPISEDGQFAAVMDGAVTLYAARYLEAPDGTFKAISTTVSPQTVVVATGQGTAFAVGDDVVFVGTSSGTLLTELASPEGIAEYGFVQGSVELPYAGHRNWALNPAWRFHGADAPPTAIAGFVDGVHVGATSIVVDGFTAGAVIKVGDVFQITSTALSVDRIITQATVTTSGTVTIVLQNGRSPGDNYPAMIHRMASRTASYWDRLPADIQHAHPYRSDRIAISTISCLAMGAHAGDATDGAYVSLDGIASGVVIRPGYCIERNDSLGRWITAGATVSTDGIARVAVINPLLLSDNQAVTIHGPAIGEGSGYVVGQPAGQSTTSIPTLSQDIFVRYVPGISNKLWACVDYEAMSALAAGGGGAASGAGLVRPPRIIIADSGGSELAALNADDWSPTATAEQLSQVLRVAHEITVSTSLKLRFRWPYRDGVYGHNEPWVWLRFIQLHMGLSESASLVEGSEATKLFYDGQIVLAAHRQWPAIYTTTNIEMADAFGVDPDTQALAMGSVIRLRAASMGISNVMLRVVGVRYDPFDPRVKQLTLGTAPKYFTDQVGRVRTRPLRVHIDVDVDAGGHVVKEAIVNEDPDAELPGSSRIVGDPGSIVTGALTIETIPDP